MKFIIFFISLINGIAFSQVSTCDKKFINKSDQLQISNIINGLFEKYKKDRNETTKKELLCVLETLDRKENKLATFILASEYFKGNILEKDFKKAKFYVDKLINSSLDDNKKNIQLNDLIYDIYYENFKPQEGMKICEERLRNSFNGEYFFYFAEKLRKKEKLFKKSIEFYEIACQLSESRACNRLTDYKFFPKEFENKLYYAPAPSSFLNNTTNSENLKSNQIDYNQIFTDEIPVDNPPDFEGGMIGFINKINEVVDTSNFMGNEGFLKTILSFTVNTDGTISDISTYNKNYLNDENESLLLNSELKKAVKKIEVKWSPAILNGVKVQYKMKFPFQINFE